MRNIGGAVVTIVVAGGFVAWIARYTVEDAMWRWDARREYRRLCQQAEIGDEEFEGEPTVMVELPEWMVETVEAWKTNRRLMESTERDIGELEVYWAEDWEPVA